MYSECFPRNRLFVRPSPSPSSPSSSSSSSTWTVVSALEWEARRTHASCACLRFSRVIDERWRETRESRAPPSRHIHWSDLYLCTPTSTVLPPPPPGLFHAVVVMVARSPRSYFVSPPLGIDLSGLAFPSRRNVERGDALWDASESSSWAGEDRRSESDVRSAC